MNKIILIKDLGMRKTKESSLYTRRFALYKCFCGNEFENIIQNVNRGQVKSCGCLLRTNPLRSHRLYGTWYMMMKRCYDKKHKSFNTYGNVGISVCEDWHNVVNFINDMFPSFVEGLTLDRINTNGNYEKDNCKWSTDTVQSRNIKQIRINNKSGYKGVCWAKNNQKWLSSIVVNRKNKYLGYYDTKEEAAKAYNNYVILNKLEHTLNIIKED